MKKTVISLLVLALFLTGCGDVVGDIAGNVAEAAQKELETQVKAAFDTYKVEVIEFHPVVGKLSGDKGELQFFCAALVQSDSDAVPKSVAESLSKMFHDAGINLQTESTISNAYLEHKDLSFKFSDFQEGKTYYTVWCYTDKLPSLEDLKDIHSTLSTGGVD